MVCSQLIAQVEQSLKVIRSEKMKQWKMQTAQLTHGVMLYSVECCVIQRL